MKYHIESKIEGPWWWRQTQYWVVSDYGSLGPYDKRSEAEEYLGWLNYWEIKYLQEDRVELDRRIVSKVREIAKEWDET